MNPPLTLFTDSSGIEGFLGWEDYQACRPWTVRLGGRWWRPWRPFRSLWSRTVRFGWRCQRLWEERDWPKGDLDPAPMGFTPLGNEDGRPHLGREYVFPLEFAIFPKTLRSVEEGCLGIAELPGRPGLYRIRGRVLSLPQDEGEGWLLDCGVRGFTFAEPCAELVVGGMCEAESWLQAPNHWATNPVAEALLRHEHDLPYHRWRVVEEGWDGASAGNPAMLAAQRIAMVKGRTPGVRAHCLCLGEVPPPHTHWLAFSLAKIR